MPSVLPSTRDADPDEPTGWNPGGLPPADRVVMRRMLVVLLGAGAAFALGIPLVFPSSVSEPAVNLTIAAIAAGCSAFIALRGDRTPIWFVHAVLIVGTLAVTSAVVNNTQSNNDDELYYLWVALFASYFLSRRAALGHLAVIAVAYAAAIAIDDASAVDDRARWLVTVSTLTGAGLVVNGLAARQRRMIGQLADAVRTDPLTGLLNRHGFQEAFSAQLAAAKRSGGRFAVLIADLDHFKRVNDSLGHAAGDEVLKRVSALLTSTTRGGDRPARLGGEEFALLIPDADRPQALGAAERVRHELEIAFAHDREPVTISIGVAVFPDDGMDSDALMIAADGALYAAKEAGRNRSADGAGRLRRDAPAAAADEPAPVEPAPEPPGRPCGAGPDGERAPKRA